MRARPRRTPAPDSLPLASSRRRKGIRDGAPSRAPRPPRRPAPNVRPASQTAARSRPVPVLARASRRRPGSAATSPGFAPGRGGDASPVSSILTIRESVMANTIVWADIPVSDMDRARKFYAAVLQAEIPSDGGRRRRRRAAAHGTGLESSGDLVRSENQKPGRRRVHGLPRQQGRPRGHDGARASRPAARCSRRSPAWATWSARSVSSRTPRATASASTSRRRG